MGGMAVNETASIANDSAARSDVPPRGTCWRVLSERDRKIGRAYLANVLRFILDKI